MDIWQKRVKSLTQALIISGTLNISLLATFAYFIFKEKNSIHLELKPKAKNTKLGFTTLEQTLSRYSQLSFQDLLLRLNNQDPVEEGYTRRDLALSCLVTLHDFNLEGALGGFDVQKRRITVPHLDGTIEFTIFPGLVDDQFDAILQYARIEKWPFTAKGLFFQIKTARTARDPSLLEAFILTSEFHLINALFSRSECPIEKGLLLELLVEGSWQTLKEFADNLKQEADFSPDKRRKFLMHYLEENALAAAYLFLQMDYEYSLKHLDDGKILNILTILAGKTPHRFAKDLLASPRSDDVLKKAAALLGEPVPTEPTRAAITLHPKEIIHTVERGESLWKISRKYNVSIQSLIEWNKLENEQIYPGKKIRIPKEYHHSGT